MCNSEHFGSDTFMAMTAIDDLLPEPRRVGEALVDRRSALHAAWRAQDDLDDALVVVPSGLVLAVEGSDQNHAFRGHDDHAYLGGCRMPGQVLVFDPACGNGEWVLFAFRASQEDRVWHGDSASLDELGERIAVSRVRPIDELGPWLAEQAGRPAALLGSQDILEVPVGYGLHPGDLEALAFDADLTQRLQARVAAARRCKDGVELAYMRAAAAASRAGHLHGMHAAHVGMSERALQVEIDYAFERAGAERPAYGTIAAGGANAAVLHATPGARRFAAQDLVLVDAGAEVCGYDSDVTRTWPIDGTYTGLQRAIYGLVLEVQRAAIAGVRAGVEYRDLHMGASQAIAQGLLDLGLLRGNADGLVERDAHALFFPHGLGHFLGLATHDVGGWTPGRVRSERPGLRFLRIDTVLAPGDVVTIEPGIYFVKALLQDPELRHKHHDDVVWEKVDALMEFGGVRIEDDVLVTDGEPEVLTHAIPKTIDDVEEALW